jgi:hypothetical protein
MEPDRIDIDMEEAAIQSEKLAGKAPGETSFYEQKSFQGGRTTS